MPRKSTVFENSEMSTSELKDQYQNRLNSGETIAQFAREANISHSTMRWRLKKLGVTTEERGETDNRYGYGQRAKVIVSPFNGAKLVETRISEIATEFGVDLRGIYGIQAQLQAVLLVLVRQKSNIEIAEMFQVKETSVRKWTKKFGIQTLARGDWAKVRAGKVSVGDILK